MEGNMKICIGLMVIMRGVRPSNNLYKLIGGILTGRGAISILDIANDNSSHLCHHCIGHMSEPLWRVRQAITVEVIDVLQGEVL